MHFEGRKITMVSLAFTAVQQHREPTGIADKFSHSRMYNIYITSIHF